jgi:hypothetical protein
MGDRGQTKVALTDSTTEWDEILINKGILSRDEVLRNKGVDPDEIRLKQAIVSNQFSSSNYERRATVKLTFANRFFACSCTTGESSRR